MGEHRLRSARVLVVESADSRKRNDSSVVGSLDVTPMRRSLLQGLVNGIGVIVAHVRAKEVPQMVFPEHDHVIETLSPDGPNDSFDVRILPRTTRRTDDFFDAHRLDPSDELAAVDPISIAEQVARSFVPRECLGHLSSGPGCGRVRGDGEMNDLSAFMAQHDETVEESKRDCRHDEKVDGGCLCHVVLQEGFSCLRRWS
jgi:hypothetical protein